MTTPYKLTPDDLIIGRLYCYFAKGHADKKPRLKFARLIKYNNTHATVEREDLTIHKVQVVKISRLKEVMKVKKNEENQQKELPL